jgi:hypothetical protein
VTDAVAPAAHRLRLDAVVRVLLSLLAGAAVIVFDLRLAPLMLAAAALAAAYPRMAVLVWIALAGTVVVPLYQVRSAGVYFSTAYLSLLLAGAATDLLLQRRAWRAPAGLTAALVTLALVAVVSGVHGALTYDPHVPGVHRFVLVQVYAAALIVLSAGAALLVAYRLDDARAVTAIVVGVGASCALLPILLVPAIPVPTWGRMITAGAMAVVYALLLHDLPRSFWLRALGVAFVLYGLAVSLVIPLVTEDRSQWISGWLAAGVALAVITWLRLPNRLRWGVSLPAAAVAAIAGWPLIERAIERASMEGDFGRFRIWKDALHLLAMRPLLGVGPGNYSDYVERYAAYHPYGSAHGNYQQVAAETGLLGLAALLWVLVAALQLAWQQRRSADPFVAALALGVLGALSGQAAASVVGDYLLPAYHNAGHANACTTLYVWVLIGALMATAARADRA